MPGLEVRSTAEDGTARLEISGELDITAAEPLAGAIDAAFDSGARELVIDLSDTTFVDSIGLSHLVTARRRADAEQATLRVLAPAGSEARVVIELTGLGGLLGVEDPAAG